jgi:hypothetical protein
VEHCVHRYGELFVQIKTAYDQLPARDRSLICAQGFHMNCNVLKLRKAHWSVDDPTKIESPMGGIFFSIWISEKGAAAWRADYNIHSYKHPQLTAYRIASQDFCRQFREEFATVSSAWPNVSTDYSSQTLMQGWFEIKPNTFVTDTLRMMKRFEKVAGIIDELLVQRQKKRRVAVR